MAKIFVLFTFILGINSSYAYKTKTYVDKKGYKKVTCNNGEEYIIYNDNKLHTKARRYCNEQNLEVEKIRGISSEKESGAP